MKNTACAVLMVILLANPLTAQDPRHGGGETPKNVCIQPQEYKLIQETQIRIEPQLRGATAAVMFQDPMADGTNSSGKTVVNYVDLDPTSGLKDYNCGTVTYNGHNGVDIEILDFYEMDEGIPVLCSAPGTVTFVRDGEDDRNTVWVTGTLANTVVVTHADGSQAYYLHFRKGSLRVPLNQTVSAGDTLGLVGSSGFSSGPHLHFEVRVSGVVKDPFQGTCQPDASLWQNQGAYVLSLPFALMNHGLTTIPLSGQTAWAMISERPPSKTHVTAGTTIYSWIRLRNVLSSDVLTWKFYANNSLWNEYSFSPSDTYSSSWWYIYWNLPASGTLYGNWKIEIYRNGALIAEQPFSYNATPNQLPVIQNTTLQVQASTMLEGELSGNDPDGSTFWYAVASAPKDGTFELSGGRNRKFRYTPNPNFVGSDTVWVYATDDENANGQPAQIVFQVGISTGVDATAGNYPETYMLFQNYPNPFNPSTTIEFSLPHSAFVTLKVFNLLSEEVTTLVSQELSGGSHRTQWNATDMAGGLYFYRLQAGTFMETRKLLLLK